MSSVGVGQFDPRLQVPSQGTDVSQPQRFAPCVVVDGIKLEPPGWTWILAYALAGCDWAIVEVEKPEFKAQYRDWMKQRKDAELEQEISALEKRLAELKQKRS